MPRMSGASQNRNLARGSGAFPMTLLRTLSTTEQTCFRRCPREHHFAYNLRRRPFRKASALSFGTVWHAGQEAWWNTSGPLAAVRLALDVIAASDLDDYEKARCSAMMAYYHQRWWDDRVRYRVLGVEVPFLSPLRNPRTGAASRTFQLGGKLDLLVEDVETGRMLIGEHKSTSESIGEGSDYWRRLRLDSQVSNYYVGARVLGYSPAGCLYNVAVKPGLRPLEASETLKTKKDGTLRKGQRTEDETPDEFGERCLAKADAARVVVVRTEAEELEGMADAWGVARSIAETAKLGIYPRNPDACKRYGSYCPYYDVCSGLASIEDDSRFETVESHV